MSSVIRDLINEKKKEYVEECNNVYLQKEICEDVQYLRGQLYEVAKKEISERHKEEIREITERHKKEYDTLLIELGKD